MGKRTADQQWRSRKRRQLRKRGVPEDEVMRLVPPGYMNDTRRANRGDFDQNPRADDCPDYYRDMLGDDADALWLMGIDDIGCK